MAYTAYALASVPRFPVPNANVRVACKSEVTVFPFARDTVSFGASCTGKEALLIKSAETKLTDAPLSKRAELTAKVGKPSEISNYNIATCSRDDN